MTERTPPLPVAAVAAGLFCVLLIYLALQIRAGRDPAIGAGHQAAAAPPQVVVRRIVIRRLVESSPASPGSDGAPASASARPAAAAAPAPAAPAPAPAPVVSRGS